MSGGGARGGGGVSIGERRSGIRFGEPYDQLNAGRWRLFMSSLRDARCHFSESNSSLPLEGGDDGTLSQHAVEIGQEVNYTFRNDSR